MFLNLIHCPFKGICYILENYCRAETHLCHGLELWYDRQQGIVLFLKAELSPVKSWVMVDASPSAPPAQRGSDGQGFYLLKE